MIGSFLVHAILTLLLLVVVGAIFIIWLRQRKSLEDQRAYEKVLHTPEVKTTYTPQDFVKAMEDKSRGRS